MQGIFQKENTDKALKYGIYRHLPTYEKIIRNLVSFYVEKDKTTHLIFEPYDEKKGIVYTDDNSIIIPYEQVENGEYSYCLVLKEK